MRVLIIGLGSMGSRRIRCLKELGINEVFGYDLNKERMNKVCIDYQILKIDNIDTFIKSKKFDACIISTSPEMHMEYAFKLFKLKIPCFIEASVCDAEKIKKLYEINLKEKILIAPSCTMCYTPQVKIIKELINKEKIGKPIYMNYQTGQYLPDWHPWEDIKDYYVSKRLTGGCREIVPFELTWINSIFGTPTINYSIRRKTGFINAEIDDYYHFTIQYPDSFQANITVEVLSRPIALRELTIVGSKGRISYSQDLSLVKCISLDSNYQEIKISKGKIAENYINPEEPYIEELSDFLKDVKNNKSEIFPNDLKKDYEILKFLEKLEYASIN